ncbi:unknown conserved protein [Lachnospiraceae bacterium KM106-2]|nr:unknown conserved protein [Lachnospiraceae bacterium KM106-2]
MKTFKKLSIATLVLLLSMSVATGCSKKKDEPKSTPSKTEAATQEPTAEPTATPETRDGQVRSKITNMWISEKAANNRPYAVMINNIKAATPQQCGTSNANVLYECLAEGGITRLMGIFEDFDAKKIGSVRSARHYYVSLATEWDAIYCHFGQTKYAVKKIEELKVDTLSGLSAIGSTVYYRDNNYKAPHNAFTSYEGIMKGTKKLGYRTTYRDNFENHYKFYNDDTDLTSDKTANKVNLGFSQYAKPYFTYNADKKMYERFQYGAKHVDANTGKQLEFKNIIVQYVKQRDIDKNHYQTIDWKNGFGKGLYITNGKAVNITWKRTDADMKMHYYAEDGSELTVNTGKTYIAIFPRDRKSDVIIK